MHIYTYRQSLIATGHASTWGYTFFTWICRLPDDGRTTWPKHVVSKYRGKK
jgi:hypothetical protein